MFLTDDSQCGNFPAVTPVFMGEIPAEELRQLGGVLLLRCHQGKSHRPCCLLAGCLMMKPTVLVLTYLI